MAILDQKAIPSSLVQKINVLFHKFLPILQLKKTRRNYGNASVKTADNQFLIQTSLQKETASLQFQRLSMKTPNGIIAHSLLFLVK